ncbi:MAG: hypothetical protein ACK4HV_07860 [Parachlamydiaceae bacterium]
MTPPLIINITPLQEYPLMDNPKGIILNKDLFWQLFCRCIAATRTERSFIHFTPLKEFFLEFFGDIAYLKSAKTIAELIRSSLIEGNGRSEVHFIYKNKGACFVRLETKAPSPETVLYYDITFETVYPAILIHIIEPALKKLGEELKLNVTSSNQSTWLVENIKVVQENTMTTVHVLSASCLLK